MIYIATLHHSTNKFIDLQDAYYKTYTKEEYVLYAGLSDLEEDIASYSRAIDDGMYEKWRLFNFDGVENQHWHKLNCLVDAITQTAEAPEEEDLLIFTDGDAFPVAPWEDKISSPNNSPTIINIKDKKIPSIMVCSANESAFSLFCSPIL